MKPPHPLEAAKAQLREKLRFRRRHFVANLDGMAQLAAFRSLPDPLLGMLTANQYRISAYAARGDEPDIIPMLQSFAPDGSLAMPFHAQRDEHMLFRLWSPSEPLEAGPWRTAQPSSQSPAIVPDIIFCPLLGFDRAGNRIGHGGGHYDRYFAKYPNIKRIGIAWSIQEVEHIPLEDTDIALDAILTEQEYIQCGKPFS